MKNEQVRENFIWLSLISSMCDKEGACVNLIYHVLSRILDTGPTMTAGGRVGLGEWCL